MQQSRQTIATDSGSGIEMVWYLQSTTAINNKDGKARQPSPQIRII
jgi:hypothetical protein